MDRIDKVKGTFGAHRKEKDLPPSGAAVARLPRYYRILAHLIEAGVLRISSGELGDMMGLTASQVRQDFRHFGDFGQQGYGYQVKYLHKKIGSLLGVEEGYQAVLVGNSPVADTLLKTGVLRQAGLTCVVRLAHWEGTGGHGTPLPSYPWQERKQALERHPVQVAVLCTSPEVTHEAVTALAELGVRGFFNCTGVPLTQLPEGVCCRDFSPEEPLLRLLYDLAQDTKTKDKQS